MNTHPYLRAYMAGIAAPSVALLIALTTFILTRLERVRRLEHCLRVVEAAPQLAHRFPWRAVAVHHRGVGIGLHDLWRIPDGRAAGSDLVPGHQRSLQSGRDLVSRRDGFLLPRLEVCGGIS